MNNLEFALEMKNKRLASGLSQGELASLTHVSRYSINRFENGKANASKETQNIILRCLNDIVNIGLHFFHKDVRLYAASCSEV